MRLIKSSVCLAAALQASFGWTQATDPSRTGTPPGVPRTAVAPAPASPEPPAFRSAFTDYRRFNADEPLKSWRRANDEARDAGGHVGMMKGTQGRAEGHEGHAAKPKEPGK